MAYNKDKNFKIGKYLLRYKRPVILGPLFKILETAGDIITPFLMGLIIDVGVSSGNKNYIITYGIIILVINLLSFAFTIISQKCSSVAQTSISKDIRSDVFAHINTLSHAELDKFTTVTLVNRMANDVSQISNAVGMTMRNMTRAPLLLIGSFIMALLINVKLSLVFVVAMPLIGFIVFFIMSKTSPLFVKTRSALDNVTNVARDNLDGVRVVRAFNKQSYEIERFEKANSNFTSINVKVSQIAAFMHPLIVVIINFGVIAILGFGGMEVNAGDLTQGNLLAFINYMFSISGSMAVIARLIINYTRTGASVKRIEEILSTKNTIESPKRIAKIDKENLGGYIEFNNVSFSYDNAKNVVNNLSIKINSGDTIGIIGGTGSGKSSIVNLIPRFYDADEGSVFVNGINVKRYDVKELRNLIGIVPQNPTLFEGTLRENMQWRKHDATDEEIIKALKIAQAYDFVKELPDFLDHKVLRGGTNFSGGQKQRLTIARAVVGNPKILILDDSSSALDFATDAQLRKTIRTTFKNSTVILVSQRATTLMHSDKIIVLDNGYVSGIGTHEELMQNCTVYKEIYYSQNKKQEEE